MDSDIALAGAYEDRPGGSGAWPELMPVNVEDFGLDENPWAWAEFTATRRPNGSTSLGAHVTAVLVTIRRGTLAAGAPWRHWPNWIPGPPG